MKRLFLLIFSACIAGCQFQSNKEIGSSISSKVEIINIGRELFEQKCTNCHGFTTEGIGPKLGGLTRTVETEWIKKFIKSPFAMVKSIDQRAIALHQEYKIYMPGFADLSDEQLNALLSYMHQFNKAASESKGLQQTTERITNPIQDTLQHAGSNLEIEYIAQVPASTENFRLALINKLACVGNSNRIFINDQRGSLYELNGSELDRYLTIQDYFSNFKDQPGLGSGFGSFAFHPNFKENGLLYTSHSESKTYQKADFALPDSIPTKFQWVIKEWKTKSPDDRQFNGTQREVLRIDFPSHLHGIQEIAFNPTASKADSDYGLLYLGVGDGGSIVKGYQQLVIHQGKRIWGTILRINPLGTNSTNGQYGIPSSNPFFTDTEKKKEIWAYGFRNPNRISWSASGQMYACDIGHKIAEEVNLILPGKFYGWPMREGRFAMNPFGNHSLAYPLPENDFNITYPIFQYDHDDGTAISGGFVSSGKAFNGHYIFGDITQGTVFIGDFEETEKRNIQKLRVTIGNKPTALSQLANSQRVDLRFGQDCEGNIYILTKADGKIYKIIN